MIKKLLENLTGKKYNYLTQRGNHSIELALNKAKELGYDKVYIADQGGWITYRQFPKKTGQQLEEIRTDFGLVRHESVSAIKDSVLLLNSSPGYCCIQDFSEIKKICQKNNNLLIQDITGTIGSKALGDILICSFGKDKPVNYGKLGLLSSDKYSFEIDEPLYDKRQLMYCLNGLDARYHSFFSLSEKIKKDLSEYDIIHQEHESINVIVLFDDLQTKEKLISYCQTNGFPYVICPKYYKVDADAVSIEVKKTNIFKD